MIIKNSKNLRVYGNKLTKYHLEEIQRDVRENIEFFANWLHVNNFKTIPHQDYKPRWWTNESGQRFHERDLFLTFQRHLTNKNN